MLPGDDSREENCLLLPGEWRWGVVRQLVEADGDEWPLLEAWAAAFADGEWAGVQVSHPVPTMKTDRSRALAWSYRAATTKLSQGEA